VYALPARYEPFGLSALEAAQAGCALVLGDIPSLREVWGDAALYVDPDDAQALTAQLQRLIGDPLLRQRMARRAVAQARHYTATAMAAAYRQRYRALIAHRGTPRVAGRTGPPVPLLSSIGVGA
ncbi:glycosyltransferase, partial [Xanthomonas sacchari]|uniref:glycosyltransferase n=1 Tax=Xanthomonas sacchari TaxID=56458 RepID=UPI00225E11BD